jgi:4-hydroxythreonine-4-phosphate dehydrogenase
MENKNNTTNNHHLPRIGITMGDFNGVGIEVIMKALQDPRILKSLSQVQKNIRYRKFHVSSS